MTAIAQTEAAKPSITLEPTITSTSSPTFTPPNTPSLTPTSTQTATFTHTPAPTITHSPTPDLRIIKDDPKDLLLQKDELPKDAKYYLPGSAWISPHHNEEIISQKGREEGLEYLETTGRVDGWWVYYSRGTTAVRAPEVIFHNPIMYKSAEGAQITVLEYNHVAEGEVEGYEYVERDIPFGDLSVAAVHKEMQSNGKYMVTYVIDTAYRNYVSRVGGWGWEEDVTYEYVENIARIAIEKLQAAQLYFP